MTSYAAFHIKFTYCSCAFCKGTYYICCALITVFWLPLGSENQTPWGIFLSCCFITWRQVMAESPVFSFLEQLSSYRKMQDELHGLFCSVSSDRTGRSSADHVRQLPFSLFCSPAYRHVFFPCQLSFFLPEIFSVIQRNFSEKVEGWTLSSRPIQRRKYNNHLINNYKAQGWTVYCLCHLDSLVPVFYIFWTSPLIYFY